ncbi:MAG: hypothetical protein ACPGRX_01945 [Bdellovibrionales bacterium]
MTDFATMFRDAEAARAVSPVQLKAGIDEFMKSFVQVSNGQVELVPNDNPLERGTPTWLLLFRQGTTPLAKLKFAIVDQDSDGKPDLVVMPYDDQYDRQRGAVEVRNVDKILRRQVFEHLQAWETTESSKNRTQTAWISGIQSVDDIQPQSLAAALVGFLDEVMVVRRNPGFTPLPEAAAPAPDDAVA